MDTIKFYEIEPSYVQYLSEYDPHIFHNRKPGQLNERKYIGIILFVNNMEYFAPLSSYKEKHNHMQETADFIKIGRYAVININNMLPVPNGLAKYVDISKVKDVRYKSLLLAEYRAIKSMKDVILKNAMLVYKHRIENGTITPLGKRCNDFVLLEDACKRYTVDC